MVVGLSENSQACYNNDIPFAFYFMDFTFIVPVIFFFVFSKKRPLWLGIASICFSIYTIRFTIPVLPIEILTIGFGIICFYFFKR
jgi:hypothetical protein